jgi:proteasome lid subunit RPN8/RPN11
MEQSALVQKTLEPALTFDQQVRMLAFAMQVAPEEACGLVFADGLSVSLKNRAADPVRRFELWPQDILDCLVSCGLSLDDVRAVWHSHPVGPSCPSGDDYAIMQKVKLPMFIVSVSSRTISGYVPEHTKRMAFYEVFGL